LEVPADYRVAIVPASDTGAFEMAMWSLLGPLPVDVFHWESFGKDWYNDIKNELKLPHVQEYSAPFGELPDLSKGFPSLLLFFFSLSHTFPATFSSPRP
jgi:phosphoserine aminotransferase